MVAGFAAAAVVSVGLSLIVVTGPPLRNAGWALLVRLAAWAVVWGLGVLCALRLPHRVAVPAVFAVALALRLASLAGQPVLSDDLYRYSWDGRVQVSGTDPYRYPPEAAQLAALREYWLWPDAQGCARLQRPEWCTRINRPSVHTIYPPVAQAWFTVVYRVAGIGAHHKAWQVAGLLGDMALVAVLPAVLRAYGRDERWTALYALSPIAVVEVVNNGHVDGLAALFAALALLAVARHRPGWAGALVGAAAMVKLYPALLGLAFVAALGVRRREALLRLIGGGAAVVALGYLPHVAAVGLRVLGYLPGYLREERYTEGARYLLLRPFGIEGLPASILAVGALAAAALHVLRQRGTADPPDAAARLLLGVLLLVVTPAQPWYALGLVAFAALGRAWWWLGVGVAGYATYVPGLIGKDAGTVGPVAYGLAAALVGAAALLQRRRRALAAAHR